ncbi:hypothetical protein CVS40_6369 [Lucilia cuprina]|nr:hypothetical protein CVS40_6369 [Lucilia cuprina]
MVVAMSCLKNNIPNNIPKSNHVPYSNNGPNNNSNCPNSNGPNNNGGNNNSGTNSNNGINNCWSNNRRRYLKGHHSSYINNRCRGLTNRRNDH